MRDKYTVTRKRMRSGVYYDKKGILMVMLSLIVLMTACGYEDDSTDNDVNAELLEAYSAYTDYIENEKLCPYMDIGMYDIRDGEIIYDQLVYSFEYIDYDQIPELVYGSVAYTPFGNIYILRYEDGEVYRYGPLGEIGEILIHERSGIIECAFLDWDSYYMLGSQGELSEIAHYEGSNLQTSEGNDYVEKYHIKGRSVPKWVYELCVRQIVHGERRLFVPYDNIGGYDHIDEDMIAELRDLTPVRVEKL